MYRQHPEMNNLSILTLNCLCREFLHKWNTKSVKNRLPLYFIPDEINQTYDNTEDMELIDKKFVTHETKRIENIIQYLKAKNNDIYCLQEVDKYLKNLLYTKFETDYHIYTYKIQINARPAQNLDMMSDDEAEAKYQLEYLVIMIRKNTVDGELKHGHRTAEQSMFFHYVTVKFANSSFPIHIVNAHFGLTYDPNDTNLGIEAQIMKQTFPGETDNILIAGDFNKRNALQYQYNNGEEAKDGANKLLNYFKINKNQEQHCFPYGHTDNDYVFTGKNIKLQPHLGDQTMRHVPFFGCISSLPTKTYDDTCNLFSMPPTFEFQEVVAKVIQFHFKAGGNENYENNKNTFMSQFGKKDTELKKNVEEWFIKNEANFKKVINSKINIVSSVEEAEKIARYFERSTNPEARNENYKPDSGLRGLFGRDKGHYHHHSLKNKDAIEGKIEETGQFQIFMPLITFLQRRNLEIFRDGEVLSDHLPVSCLMTISNTEYANNVSNNAPNNASKNPLSGGKRKSNRKKSNKKTSNRKKSNKKKSNKKKSNRKISNRKK